MRIPFSSGRAHTCISLLMVVLVVSVGWACGSSPTSPSLGSPLAQSPAPAPEIPAFAFNVSGLVTNEEGAPVGDVVVSLTYQPDLAATQVVNTRTGVDGRYQLHLDARQPGNVNALIRAIGGGTYWPVDQFVRLAASTEKNLRLRPVRTIIVGQSAAVRFDGDSSLCASIGVEGSICEWVRVQYPATFTQMLTVRAAGSGVPTLRALVPSPYTFVNVANASTSLVVGQGSVTFQSGDDESWDRYRAQTADVAILIPAGMAPQAYEVMVFPQNLP